VKYFLSLVLSTAAVINPFALASDHSSLEERVAALESRWFQSITVDALLEIEAIYTDLGIDDSSTDLVVATAELGFEGEVNDELSASVVLLHEEDDTPLEVDVAVLTYQAEGAWSVTIGQNYLPFGAYETTLVNDPLTLELGETRETAAAVTFSSGSFAGTFFLFNGEQDENGRDELTNFGGRLQISGDVFLAGIDYISNLADSDSLQGNDFGYTIGAGTVAGTSVYGGASLGNANLFLEHLGTLDPLLRSGDANAEPSAMQIELVFGIGEVTYSIALQQTDEAILLALPEQRLSLGVSTEVFGGLGFGVELYQDDYYDVVEGGSGESANSLIIQLSAEI
jgi:hypothetical protein